MDGLEIKSFRDLDAWRAIELAVSCYTIASQLPASERFELSAQVRRAAGSIPSNIAEGQATGVGKRYSHHVRIALGSAGELGTLFEVIRRIGFPIADLDRAEQRLVRTCQLLHGLARSLRRRGLGATIVAVPPLAGLLDLVAPAFIG